MKEKEKRTRDWESANYCGLMLSFGEARERFALLERGYPLNVKPREIVVASELEGEEFLALRVLKRNAR
ncbi:MAG: hypothetical protein IJ679_01470 [Lachnospiraceae bacterium]|nr:hypothetical protein [Lachnospiraceae bacterium]